MHRVPHLDPLEDPADAGVGAAEPEVAHVHAGGACVAERTGDQSSNVLSATAAANALALVPDGDGIAKGDPVDVMLLDAPADH